MPTRKKRSSKVRRRRVRRRVINTKVTLVGLFGAALCWPFAFLIASVANNIGSVATASIASVILGAAIACLFWLIKRLDIKPIEESKEFWNAASRGLSLLEYSVHENNTQRVSELLSKPMRSRIFGPSNAFHNAVRNSNVPIIQLFLDAGIDPDLEDESGITPLMLARSWEVADLLLKSGANINATSPWGFTALHSAEPNLTQHYLEAGADASAVTDNGSTPIHLMVHGLFHGIDAKEISEGITLLINAGCDPNAKDCNGNTALHECVKAYEPSCTALLAHSMSDVDALNLDGESALHYACLHDGSWGDEETVHIAALIENGADVNLEDVKQRNTPLHMAATKGNISGLRLLLQGGANPNVFNSDGMTPLHCAMEHSDFGEIDVLLEFGADPNAMTSSSALHHACVCESPETISKLVKAGANIELKDSRGRTSQEILEKRKDYSLVLSALNSA